MIPNIEKMIQNNNSFKIFESKKIRKEMYNGEWNFSIVDIIG